MILPAFIVTAVLDYTGKALDARLYGSEALPFMDRRPLPGLLSYALSAAFLGESWMPVTRPGSNLPFWTLNYQAWYCVLFVAATFLQGGNG